MKIGGFVKNSFVDYPGNISCVIFTSGCNMNCWFCHNQSLISEQDSSAKLKEIFDFIEGRKGFLDGVVVSGGEPTLQPDLEELLRRIKGLGLKVKLDSNGTNYEILKDLINKGLVDFVAMDIKAPFECYRKITQKDDNIEAVRNSAKFLINGTIDYEFRTTFAPNLTVEDIENLAKDIQGAKKLVLQKCRLDEEEVSYMAHKPSMVQRAVELAQKYVKEVSLRGY